MIDPYFPVDEKDYRIILGLQPLRGESWIDIDENYARQIQLKRDLIESQGDKVFNTLDGRESASAEIYHLIKSEISANYPDQKLDEIGKDAHPLLKAASIVQEDLVLMQPTDHGYILGAACVCFPTGWNLLEKMGRPLWDIHEDVPGLNDQIGHSIDKFFQNLKPGKKVKRFNWGLYDSNELFQPLWWREEQNETENVTPETIGEHLTFRVEKQTLQRLIRSNDILFTIRIFNSPLHEISRDEGRRKALLHAVQTMPADMQNYKSLTPYKDLIVDYLEG